VAGRLSVSLVKEHAPAVRVSASFDLEPDNGRILALFGPSGSGKTTILRCLAGLERPQHGSIRYDDETWFDAARGIDLPPQDRRLGYVSQEYGLFPHLTVGQNIRFGMQPEPPDADSQVADILQAVRLGGMGDRLPSQLSGGQRQRVALARMLARKPRLILLDEPLVALDSALRDPMRHELREFLRSVDVPSIIVTHDRVDALTIADRMAVLIEGSIRQVGAVDEVFSRPVDPAVAAAVGVETVIAGEVVDNAGGLLTIRVGRSTVCAASTAVTNGPVFVCLRAEDVILETSQRAGGSARNHWSGNVSGVQYEGAVVRVIVDCGFRLTALLTRPAFDELQLRTGAWVSAVAKATAIHVVPR
jgi:molybdenum ABC transporter ATP-binding protein